MLKITKQTNSIQVVGVGNTTYPYNGTLTFPFNSVVLTLDSSNMAVFRSVANNDVLFSALVDDITIDEAKVTKDDIVDKFIAIANVSNSGGESYTLPIASAETLGGIKVGNGLSIGEDGTLSSTGGGTADTISWNNVTDKPAEIENITTELNAKQDTLVSGTNIKTINGETLLGNGDITIQGGGDPYTLPIASATTLGGIKIGTGLSIDESGVATAVGKVDPNSDGTGEIFNYYEGNTASGAYSHAEGNVTTASGESSHAEGNSTEATGNSSHSEGAYTIASGEFSHAEGKITDATGIASHAEGEYTTAQNDSEHAQGKYNVSHKGSTDSDKTIHSIGIGTGDSDKKNAVEVMTNGDVYVNGIGDYDGTNYASAKTLQEVVNSSSTGGGTADSVAWENVTNKPAEIENITTELNSKQDTLVSGTNIKTINGETILGNGDITIQGGGDSYTLPIASSETLGGIKIGRGLTVDESGTTTAVGKVDTNSYNKTGEIFNDYTNNKASGAFSHAEGMNTKATGSYSHAEGDSTNANEQRAHAEGFQTTANGNCSHAEGSSTYAGGTGSHAEGNSTQTYGNNSHAEGYFTTANNKAEHAQGSYNVSHKGSTDADKTIHSIGIGSYGNQKNAVEVMTNGDVYIVGVGGYDGTNYSTAKSVQELLTELSALLPQA